MPSDCPQPNQYCKVAGCAVSGGTCTTKPTNQPAPKVPVCGCDNVTYWNETILAGFGVNLKSGGICPGNTAATCKPGLNGTKCANNRFCNGDTAVCPVAIPSGVCWGLPTICPPTTKAEVIERACNASGSTGSCLSYCEAVRGERSFAEDKINCP